MPLPDDPDKLRRHWRAGGGFRAEPPVRPRLAGEWRPGDPAHWTERTAAQRWHARLVRLLIVVHLASGIVYLQFRARETIGIFEFSRKVPIFAYQVFFFVLECLSVFSIIFRLVELWSPCHRNSVDLHRIPNDMIAPDFQHSPRSNVRPEHSNYPSVGVFIPCYNEDVDLVLETLLGAVNIDYPRELLTIYLCDDGKDNLKRAMVSQLRKQYKNLHYVIRPEHCHAKAGNLNYSLERTNTHLVVTLDADFVARPNLLQRLIPYYFVWNSDTQLYEFNETVAVVQTPQHFRNLSPYDSDPLDQRSTFFFDLVLPGKDWLNSSTMIGTTNLLSRKPLIEAGYYPYHSVTEDTAMSLRFHALGYRTYYVNESLATGLATTSLWSNLGQRARWLKGDWQIFFSRHGPLTQKGLNFIQRLLYLNMSFMRIISVVHLMYDICAIVLLLGGIAPLDAPDAVKFIIFISVFLGTGVLMRAAVVLGGNGLEKSDSGSVAFEAIFRYITIKGIFIALFKGQNVQFKVTDKASVKKPGEGPAEEKQEGLVTEQFDENARMTVLGRPEPGKPAQGMAGGPQSREALSSEAVDHTSSSSTAQEDVSSGVSEEDDGRGFKKARRKWTPEERAVRRKDTRKNLKRVWFNVVMAALLTISIVYGIVNPPTDIGTQFVVLDGVPGRYKHDNLLPVAMAIGFAAINLLPHLLAIYLCFIPYVSGWMMTDLVHGRCDQYAVHPRTGKLFVPWSFISLLSLAKLLLMLGSVGVLAIFTFTSGDPQFVPDSVGG